jgi:hypothetical protein
VETRPWQIELPSRKLEVELTTVSSNYHVEINPGDVGSNDRYVVQEIIKELAKNRPLDVSGEWHWGAAGGREEVQGPCSHLCVSPCVECQEVCRRL